jgi:hypothetical protein
MHEAFIFNSIRRYNQATRQLQRDCILHAVGRHVNLIERPGQLLPELSQEERDRVLKFLREFLKAEGLTKIELKSF